VARVLTVEQTRAVRALIGLSPKEEAEDNGATFDTSSSGAKQISLDLYVVFERYNLYQPDNATARAWVSNGGAG
jgi:hypothetical protein